MTEAALARRPATLILASLYYAWIALGVFFITAIAERGGHLGDVSYWTSVSDWYVSWGGLLYHGASAVCAVLLVRRDARALWCAAVVGAWSLFALRFSLAPLIEGPADVVDVSTVAWQLVNILLVWRIHLWRKRGVLS